jgi:hypothetical protein
MLNPKIIPANIVSAFGKKTVGTKVTNATEFMARAVHLVGATNFEAQREPGQAYIPANELCDYVSAGVGERSQNPADYVARLYRGNVELFLRRKKAAKVAGVALIVYTREAYLKDPDVLKETTERNRIEKSDCTHVLVAVLGFAGPKAPLSPYRLVHNLAGGNNEVSTWTVEDIKQKAAESKTYHDTWCTVAD